MAEIVLATLNARFIHTAFGLRYLLANLGPLRSRAEIAEFEIHQPPAEIVESLLARQPRIIGLGIYIWNARPALDVVALLRRVAPHVRIVLGGPEVSHETEDQEIVRLADHTVTGEADIVFAELCRNLLEPGTTPVPRIVHAPLPDLSRVLLPYEDYTESDLAHRLIYVEASRGCPFTCEFCLSSLDVPVRPFPLPAFLDALRRLLDRGARQFKFVDRTFNLNLEASRGILRFFHEHWRDGMFLHFEMVPDRLPEPLREDLSWFPAGRVQLEIGIQSFNPEVCARIRRRQNVDRTEQNFRFLREHTGAHLHADLIAGLPGENLDSFADGFDRLLRLGPQEIQVGILKRLRGTPIVRHDAEWDMAYSPVPPYEILRNRDLDFATVQRLRRFARYWDLVANSGRFARTRDRIWAGHPSPFRRFLAFADWLYAELGQTHAIALDRLAHALYRWLTGPGGVDAPVAAADLAADWRRSGHRDLPAWLPADGNSPLEATSARRGGSRTEHHARRQARHQQHDGSSPHSSHPS